MVSYNLDMLISDLTNLRDKIGCSPLVYVKMRDQNEHRIVEGIGYVTCRDDSYDPCNWIEIRLDGDCGT